MRRTFLILLAASLVAKAAWAQEDWTPDQRAVLAAIDSYLAAWNTQDADALAQLCAADCDRIDARGNVYSGRDAIRAHYEDVFSRPSPPGFPRRLSYEVQSIRLLSPSMAIVDANYLLENPPPCPGGTISGMNTVVLTKQDGRWLRQAHRQRIPDQLSLSRDCQQVIMEDNREPGDDVATVIAIQDSMIQAMVAGDSETFLGHLSRDFVASDPSNTVRRYQDLVDVVTSGRLRYEDIDDDVDFAEQLGDRIVVVMGTETTRQSAVPVEGELEQRAIAGALARRYTNVFRKEGNSWRLLVKQSTIIEASQNR